MPTEAQVNANRRNAQHSTGPQTARGKGRSALNGLKHGLRARIILTHESTVPGESTSPFARLLADLVAEYAPVGFVESHCVETMAVAAWRLRLVVQSELESSNDPNADLRYEWDLKFDKMNREQDAALLARGIKPFAPNPPVIPPERHCLPPPPKLLPLIRYEAHLDRQFHRAFTLLRELQLARASQTSPADDGKPPEGDGTCPVADGSLQVDDAGSAIEEPESVSGRDIGPNPEALTDTFAESPLPRPPAGLANGDRPIDPSAALCDELGTPASAPPSQHSPACLSQSLLPNPPALRGPEPSEGLPEHRSVPLSVGPACRGANMFFRPSPCPRPATSSRLLEGSKLPFWIPVVTRLGPVARPVHHCSCGEIQPASQQKNTERTQFSPIVQGYSPRFLIGP